LNAYLDKCNQDPPKLETAIQNKVAGMSKLTKLEAILEMQEDSCCTKEDNLG